MQKSRLLKQVQPSCLTSKQTKYQNFLALVLDDKVIFSCEKIYHRQSFSFKENQCVFLEIKYKSNMVE